MSHDIRMTIEIGADRARVFEALTSRDDLRAWFAEDAEVTPQTKRYDFGGRHTPGAPERDASHHDLLAYDPPTRLAYDWTIRGGESKVSFVLANSKKGTNVELHHALARGRTAREGAMSDFWAASLERLKAWVEHRHRGYFPDYSKAPADELKMSVEIEASAADIFRALTDSDRIERWLAMPGKAKIDGRVGGRYDIGWEDGGPKTILAYEPGKRLAYSWSYKSEPDTVAVWTMEPAGAATRLTITHSGFGDSTRYEPYFMGWGFFLNRIKLLLEADQGRSVVSTEDDYEEEAA